MGCDLCRRLLLCRRGGGHGDTAAKVALAAKFSVAAGAKWCALTRCPFLSCFRVVGARETWQAAWAKLFAIAEAACEAAAVDTCCNEIVVGVPCR